jgi:hypothetical protein
MLFTRSRVNLILDDQDRAARIISRRTGPGLNAYWAGNAEPFKLGNLCSIAFDTATARIHSGSGYEHDDAGTGAAESNPQDPAALGSGRVPSPATVGAGGSIKTGKKPATDETV